MKRERIGLIMVIFLTVILLATVITIKSNTHRDRDTGGDDIDEVDPIEPQFINISMKDAFMTDRLSSRFVAGFIGEQWLVFWIEITNEGKQDYNTSYLPIDLRTDRRTIHASSHNEIINSFRYNQSLPPNGTSEGWIHFSIDPDETPLELIAVDHWRVGFYGTYNLTHMEFEHRPWKTPLVMEIEECGRDGAGGEHPGIFYINISVINTGGNATIFEHWHLQMNVTGDGYRDVMFGVIPENTWIYGGHIQKFKLYFDIPMGSTELPETLFSLLNWIFIDVDPDLYMHLV